MKREHIDPGDEPKHQRRVEIKPAAYIKPDRPVPPGGGSVQRIVLARHGRKKAEPRPDPRTPDITGRYESEQHDPGTGDPVLGYLLHVNQAGKELYGAFVEVLDARTRRPRDIVEFGGRLTDDGSFALYTDDGEGNHLLKVEGDVIRVAFSPVADGRDLRFRLTEGRRPTMFGEALEAMLALHEGAPREDLDLLRAIEATPLSFAQVARLRSLLSPDVIGGLIAEFHAVGSATDAASHLWRANAAEKLDTYIGRVFSTAPPDGWHEDDLPQLRLTARLMLTSDRHRFGGTTKSPIQWIEDLAASVTQSEKLARDLPNLRAHLGVRAKKGVKPDRTFEYRIVVSLKSKTRNVAARWTRFLKAEGFYGTVRVERAWMDHSGAPFTAWFVGGGVEVSTKVLGGGDIHAVGTIVTNAEWSDADFLGWAKLLDAGYWAGVKPSSLPKISDLKKKAGPGWDRFEPVTKHLDKTYEVVPSQRQLALVIHGNGAHERLIVPLTIDPKARHGAGATFAVCAGRLMKPDVRIEDVDDGRTLKTSEVFVRRVDRKEVHFDLGVALLRGSGRQALRMFCARELPWLSYAGSRMLVVGHADRIDTPERNMELSRLRAENVAQCLEDILGSKLALRMGSGIEIRSLGEDAAKSIGVKDGRPSPEWRKVDLFLDGRQVLTLWGEA